MGLGMKGSLHYSRCRKVGWMDGMNRVSDFWGERWVGGRRLRGRKRVLGRRGLEWSGAEWSGGRRRRLRAGKGGCHV